MDQTEYETAAACMVAAGALARDYRDELLRRVGVVFARREPRLQAGKYVRALAAEVPRKNGWQIAEWVGDATPDKTQSGHNVVAGGYLALLSLFGLRWVTWPTNTFCAAVAWRNHPPEEGTPATVRNAVANLDRDCREPLCTGRHGVRGGDAVAGGRFAERSA